jgi:hypothetical protein
MVFDAGYPLDGTGWRRERTLGDGPSYVAIIDKAPTT